MNQISEITRRNLFDALRILKVDWSGRLEEPEFLGRVFDLTQLPSHDSRFNDAEGDIWQHRINNWDWDDDWVFSDPRFALMDCDDEALLNFLCETLHPVVRSDAPQVEQLRQLYNQHLEPDGFQLVEKTRISGRPIFIGRYVGLTTVPGIRSVHEILSGDDPVYVAQQITRMEAAIHNDPGLAIGTAKELVETCCKTILQQRDVAVSNKWDLPKLVRRTTQELQLTPDDIPQAVKASDTIKRLLSNLATITNGVAELRNQYGTGHGKEAQTKGLTPRHAKLAVGAASTLAVFLVETHRFRP